MSAKALHLNLLTPHERKSASPVRARIILPIIAGICLVFVLGWAVLVGIQLTYASSRSESVEAQITALSGEHALVTALKARYRNQLAEKEQFDYYANGRVTRGELFKRLAYAIPEGITLSALSLPPPADQRLRPPPGSPQQALQGPNETSESVQLRLAGTANAEQDVFQLMNALKGDAFTNLVVIAERPTPPAPESPRVVAFRQVAGQQGVYFDLVYELNPRRFVK